MRLRNSLKRSLSVLPRCSMDSKHHLSPMQPRRKAADTLPQGVVMRQGDYSDPASLHAAFQGVEILLLISFSKLQFEARLREHRNAINAAQQAGVRHLVHTSLVNPSPELAFGASLSHFATNEYLRTSGPTHTILRNTLYLGILPMMVGEGTLASGKLCSSVGGGKVSYALREELAEALANVLTPIRPRKPGVRHGPRPHLFFSRPSCRPERSDWPAGRIRTGFGRGHCHRHALAPSA